MDQWEGRMFDPYIGEQWAVSGNILGGLRLLILGESHYSSDTTVLGKTTPGATKDVVREFINGERRRFFTGLTQVIAGKHRSTMTQQEIEAVWASVAFYNYVPVYVADGARERPSRDMFMAGGKPFEQVLSTLQPQAILVCGYELWGWLIRGLPNAPHKPWETMSPHKVGSAPAMRMMHPSANFFSSTKWRPAFEDLCRQAKSTEPAS